VNRKLFHFPFIISHMRLKLFLVSLALSACAYAGIIEDVRTATAQNKFPLAESEVRSYKSRHGATPELAEAVSWMARNAFRSSQLDPADKYAREARALVAQQLNTRRLDSDPHLPIALGAAIEVQAQVLTARGERQQAVTLLQSSLRSYGRTSIRARLQKNLNLLALVGQPAPPLREDKFLGSQPKSLAQLKGAPVLLFFWAHWCNDCKYEGPIIARLRSEYAPKGLNVIAPTQFYGYAGQGEDASPETELAWIDTVRRHFYSGLLDVPVPVAKANFDSYGASTTPTLVIISSKGVVDLYHPGLMSYDELRGAIDQAFTR
jgi:thiol-disulfide isomerase/thioredoxin